MTDIAWIQVTSTLSLISILFCTFWKQYHATFVKCIVFLKLINKANQQYCFLSILTFFPMFITSVQDQLVTVTDTQTGSNKGYPTMILSDENRKKILHEVDCLKHVSIIDVFKHIKCSILILPMSCFYRWNAILFPSAQRLFVKEFISTEGLFCFFVFFFFFS